MRNPVDGIVGRGALRSQRPQVARGRVREVAEFICIHETDASLLPCLLRRLKGTVALGPPEVAAGVGYFQSDDVLVRKRPLAS